jgi:hypothetical protein
VQQSSSAIAAQQTRHLADQVNQLGRMDAVIHNAGVYGDRDATPAQKGTRWYWRSTRSPYC